MRLNVKALALTLGLVWGGAVLAVGVAQEIWPMYGMAFLELVSSIYPGFTPGGYGAVIVGALYGFVDGAVGGLVVAWLYNRFVGSAAQA